MLDAGRSEFELGRKPQMASAGSFVVTGEGNDADIAGEVLGRWFRLWPTSIGVVPFFRQLLARGHFPWHLVSETRIVEKLATNFVRLSSHARRQRISEVFCWLARMSWIVCHHSHPL